MRALVTGATGFVGAHLVARLERAVVLSRDADAARRRFAKRGIEVEAHAWIPEAGPPPAAALTGVDTVFHLAGEPVAEGRWSAEKKARIRDSRVLGTRNLVASLRAAGDGKITSSDGKTRARTLISASAVGYYGDRGDELLDEQAAAGGDFLAEVCRAWEAESGAATALGLRVVNPRIGVVLGSDGGALAKMLPPFKLGVGGRLGAGHQWMPWIHVDDLVALLLHAATHEQLSGPMNAVAPSPVTNRDFTRALGRALHRPAIFPVPRAALRAAFGEVAAVLMASQRAVPSLAERSGFQFRYPTIDAALQQLFAPRPAAK